MQGGVYTSKLKNGKSKYRWKRQGFSSSLKLQEQYKLFKAEFCLNCGISNSLHQKVFKYALSLHHIDSNRNNNLSSNLKTLCSLCHYLEDSSARMHWHRMLKKFHHKVNDNLILMIQKFHEENKS